MIGADGVNSVVARAVGLTTGFADEALAIDTMEETPLAELAVAEPDTMYVAYGYKGYPGYGYVFPKRDCVDAGVGFLLPFFKRTLGGAPYEHHARFLDEVAARGIVRGRSNPDNFKAYRLPLGGPLARTYADRTLVCGDAGGFVNAYTGEGIYYAMVTGRHAGETAADAAGRGRRLRGAAGGLRDAVAGGDRRGAGRLGAHPAAALRPARAGRRGHPRRRARREALPAVRAGGAGRGQPARPPAGDGLAVLRGEAARPLAAGAGDGLARPQRDHCWGGRV